MAKRKAGKPPEPDPPGDDPEPEPEAEVEIEIEDPEPEPEPAPDPIIPKLQELVGALGARVKKLESDADHVRAKAAKHPATAWLWRILAPPEEPDFVKDKKPKPRP